MGFFRMVIKKLRQIIAFDEFPMKGNYLRLLAKNSTPLRAAFRQLTGTFAMADENMRVDMFLSPFFVLFINSSSVFATKLLE